MIVCNIDPTKMTRISNLGTKGYNIVYKMMAPPPTKRDYPAITNFNNECIFVGGSIRGQSVPLKTVDMYNINQN